MLGDKACDVRREYTPPVCLHSHTVACYFVNKLKFLLFDFEDLNNVKTKLVFRF